MYEEEAGFKVGSENRSTGKLWPVSESPLIILNLIKAMVLNVIIELKFVAASLSIFLEYGTQAMDCVGISGATRQTSLWVMSPVSR